MSHLPRSVIYFLMALLLFGLSAIAGQLIARGSALSTDEQPATSNQFGTLALGAPGNLAASMQGHDVNLSWSPGENGTEYTLLGAGSSSPDCSQASFSNVASTGDTGYLDNGRYAPQGSWYCYQVQTTRGAWTSVQNNPIEAVQIGFVAETVQIINGGSPSTCGGEQSGVAGEIDCGDQIMVTFNQPVAVNSGPSGGNSVCANQSANVIWLGSATTAGDCAASESVTLGQLTGGTIGNCDCRFDASYAWSNNDQTLVVTIGARVSGSDYPAMSSAVWTFAPTTDNSRMLSASGNFHICDSNNGGGNCLPGTTAGSGLAAMRSLPALPTETVTPWPTPTSTATVWDTLTATPIETATPLDTPTATPIETATPPETLTPTPLMTETITPTETPTAIETFTPTPSPTAIDTYTPTATPSITPTATMTETVTPTATGTLTPTPTP